MGETFSDIRFNEGRVNPKYDQREIILKDDLLLLSSSPSSSSKSSSVNICPPPKKRKLSSNTDSSLSQQQEQHRRQPLGLVAYSPCGKVSFPGPSDRNVYMMPFVFGAKSSLPQDLQCYFDIIEECPYNKKEIGKVGYLTIHESYVEANTALGKSGLHIEVPDCFSDADTVRDEMSRNNTVSFTPGIEHKRGQGMLFGPDQFEGGNFMAWNMKNTNMVWDALVDKDAKGIVDCHGECEHLRPLLGSGYTLRANESIWMTDCTPHQTLAPKESGYYQFFRIVTSQVSHWYSQRSTPNPLVPLPSNVIEV